MINIGRYWLDLAFFVDEATKTKRFRPQNEHFYIGPDIKRDTKIQKS